MEITTEQVEGAQPVTILRLAGDLDAASYEGLIAAARAAQANGVQRLILDMRQVPFMGSSGLVALHSIALLLAGQQPPDPEAGWRALRAVGEAMGSGPQPHVKLLSPTPAVERVLDRSGLLQFFEVHTDQQAAVSSF